MHASKALQPVRFVDDTPLKSTIKIKSWLTFRVYFNLKTFCGHFRIHSALGLQSFIFVNWICSFATQNSASSSMKNKTRSRENWIKSRPLKSWIKINVFPHHSASKLVLILFHELIDMLDVANVINFYWAMFEQCPPTLQSQTRLTHKTSERAQKNTLNNFRVFTLLVLRFCSTGGGQYLPKRECQNHIATWATYRVLV